MLDSKLVKKLVWENAIKHLLNIVIIILLLSYISGALNQLQSNLMGNFLTMISILLVTVCFANFTFVYGHLDMHSFGVRLFSHIATFLFLLTTTVLLSILMISVKIVYPSLFPLILLVSILLYLSIVLFDFWDALKAASR